MELRRQICQPLKIVEMGERDSCSCSRKETQSFKMLKSKSKISPRSSGLEDALL